MKSEHQTKSGHMMRSLNKWSIFFLAIALTATGELWDFSRFVARHPSVLWQIGLFSVASALGQYFIFMLLPWLANGKFSAGDSLWLAIGYVKQVRDVNACI